MFKQGYELSIGGKICAQTVVQILAPCGVHSKVFDPKKRKKLTNWVKSFSWILLLGQSHVVPKLNLITFSKRIETLLRIPELDLPPFGAFYLSN